MNKQLLFAMVLGLSTMGGTLTSCSNGDDQPVEQTENTASSVNFTIYDGGKATTSTFTFSITPSDNDTPYLYFCVPQSEFAGLTKERLARKLIHELQREAAEKGQDFDTYVAGKMVKGSYTATVENLTGGGTYQIIAFALSGTEPAGQVGAMYFQTPLVDKKQMSFTVTGAWTADGYTLSVKPSNENISYYVALMTKDGYEQNKQKYTDEDILLGLLANEINDSNPSSSADVVEAFNKLVTKGNLQLTYKGVEAGMNLVWIAGGVELVENNTDLAASTNVTTGALSVPAQTAATASPASYVMRNLFTSARPVISKVLK